MKRKTGIALFIILNLAFIAVIIQAVALSYGVIVAPLGQERGLEVAGQITNAIVMRLSIFSVVMLLVNYFLIVKMIAGKKPFLTSMLSTAVGIIIFIPFFISARQSFIDYQNGTTMLYHYLEQQTISEASIITLTDTIKVKQRDNFIRDIALAKYKRGLWKYAKTMKIIFKRTDGSKDSLFTNGQMFGAYKGKYFFTDGNIMDKYLANGKRNSN